MKALLVIVAGHSGHRHPDSQVVGVNSDTCAGEENMMIPPVL